MGRRKILITGGMGYVGGRVAQMLVARGDLDIVLGSRREHLPPTWLPGVRVVRMHWNNPENLLSVCDGIDTVLHLAAMNDGQCARDPVAALEINGVNSVRLVEAAKNCNVGRFIYLSTAHIYGSPLAGRIDETTLPCSRHPYASSHRAAEDVVLAARSQLTSIVLRLSNGFGVPAHADVNCWMLLANDLCRQAVTDHRLVLRSSGLQQRNFVTLYDVARGISHMLDLPSSAIADGLFNFGGGCSLRIVEIAEIVQARCTRVLGFTPEIKCPEPLPGEVGGELEYCIGKLLATGFNPSDNFDEEIDATLRFCHQFFGQKS